MKVLDSWILRAACRTTDAEALFVQGIRQKVVKRICDGCPVSYDCLAAALDNRIDTGIWGCVTERERRALLRQHPSVSDWRGVLDVLARQEQVNARPGQRGRDAARVVRNWGL
jgi:WhiB family transcriptional regulator, redox-sensing transcriptional regulator